MWLDEAFTASHLDRSFTGMLSAVTDSGEATPPLYFVVGWLWAQVFGMGEVALRSLPALCGIATIPVTFMAGRELFSSRVGLTGAALAATSPLFVHYSQEARAYSLMLLLTALALLGFARVLRTQARRDWLLWLTASGLAVATHYFAAFAVVPLAAWLLIRVPTRMAVGWVATLGVIGAAMLPFAVHQAPELSTNYLSSISLWSRMQQIAQSPLVGDSGLPVARKVWAAALVALVAVAIYGLRSPIPFRRNAVMLASVGAATLALPLIFAAAGVDGVLARYLQTAWIPLALVLAAGLTSASAPFARSLMAGTTIALCVAGSVLAATEARDPARQRDDWRTYVPLVEGGAMRPSATVISPGYDRFPFQYYAPRSVRLPGSGARVRELDVVHVFPHGGFPPVLRVIAPSAFLGGYAPASRIVAPSGFVIRFARTQGRLTLVRLVARSPRRITARMVRTLTFDGSTPSVLLDSRER